MHNTKKYMFAVFKTGDHPMKPSIRDLLVYNRRRSAEAAVQQAKKLRIQALER